MIRLLYLILASILLFFQINNVDFEDKSFVEEKVDLQSIAVLEIAEEVIENCPVTPTDLVLSSAELTREQRNILLDKEQAKQIISELYLKKTGDALNNYQFETADVFRVTRAEFAKMFSVLVKDEKSINECSYITDVQKHDEAFDEILALYNIGIVSGSNKYGAFFKDSPVTVGMARNMKERLLDKSKRVHIKHSYSNKFACIEIENILQNPELPTGCEITSLAIVLNHLGFDADKLDLADNYLEKGEIGTANPYKVFVGTPYESSSYGCFSPVIEMCANKFLWMNYSQLSAYDITGIGKDQLFMEIEQGNPVIVWATMGMTETEWIDRWEIDGEIIKFPRNEHCMVLHGFDVEDNVVYISDPLVGNVQYNMDLFFERFENLLCQAVIIK